MKQWIWILVAFLGLQGVAGAEEAYENLSCRSNDPFVFCTQGCKPPDRHWRPVGTGSGWAPIAPYCPYPTVVGTKYCKGWSVIAYNAWWERQRICHVGGGKASDWTGRQRPETVPGNH